MYGPLLQLGYLPRASNGQARRYVPLFGGSSASRAEIRGHVFQLPHRNVLDCAGGVPNAVVQREHREWHCKVPPPPCMLRILRFYYCAIRSLAQPPLVGAAITNAA